MASKENKDTISIVDVMKIFRRTNISVPDINGWHDYYIKPSSENSKLFKLRLLKVLAKQ